MDVLIKGMEIPKPKLADMATVYYAYILVSPNGHAEIVVDNEDGLDSTAYPLVPVPPHGRLIDADYVMNNMRSEHPYVQNAIRATISAAPTIIEAEEVFGQYTDPAGNLHWTGTYSGEHIVKAEEARL